MHTTWRGTTAQILIGVSTLLALSLAIALGTSGQGILIGGLAWLLVLALAGAAVTTWLHLRQMERFRQQLATGLTHHLRTSLAHIQAFNEMLLLGSESSEEQRVEWLEVVGREAERLGTAVENVLLIVNQTRPDAYAIRRKVDLAELLEDVACSYHAVWQAAPAARGEAGAGIIVQADPAALKHALVNLFSSITRYQLPESRLSAGISATSGTATIVVGLDRYREGTPREMASGRPFRESDLEGETGTGFGLEMAVVQHVVRAHGGRTEPFHEAGVAGYRLQLPLAGA